MLETKTVCSFEIFKTGKQNNASVFTVFCSLSRRSEPKILNGRNVHGPFWKWVFVFLEMGVCFSKMGVSFLKMGVL